VQLRLSNWEGALKEFQKLLKNTQALPLYYYAMGVYYHYKMNDDITHGKDIQQDFAKFLQFHQNARFLAPHFHKAFYAPAQQYLHLKKPGKALELLVKIQEDLKNPELLCLPPFQRRVYRIFFEVTKYPVWIGLSQAYFLLKSYDMALQYAKIAVKLYPSKGEGYYLQGMIYLFLKNRKEGEKSLKKALSLFPLNSTKRKKIQKILNKIKKK
ncbi:MAG: hypothetical protein D6785_02490, partial [Planctomycetota bacterium]